MPRSDLGQEGRFGRHLLGYQAYGDTSKLNIITGHEYDWVADTQHLLNMTTGTCRTVLAALEPRVNRFGYSLFHPYHLESPAAFLGHMLKH